MFDEKASKVVYLRPEKKENIYHIYIIYHISFIHLSKYMYIHMCVYDFNILDEKDLKKGGKSYICTDYRFVILQMHIYNPYSYQIQKSKVMDLEYFILFRICIYIFCNSISSILEIKSYKCIREENQIYSFFYEFRTSKLCIWNNFSPRISFFVIPFHLYIAKSKVCKSRKRENSIFVQICYDEKYNFSLCFYQI